MKIKVCGITQKTQLCCLDQMGIDFAGFIFYKKSKRWASDLALNTPTKLKKIGVFVNAHQEEIIEKITQFDLDLVQLHGDEPPDFCEKIRHHLPIIKAFGMHENFHFQTLEEYQSSCDFFLFDSATPQYGGSGRGFDWDLLKDKKIEKPFFLSGGISPDHALKIKEIEHLSSLFSLDLNSRFEQQEGVKNLEKIRHFIKNLKHEQL